MKKKKNFITIQLKGRTNLDNPTIEDKGLYSLRKIEDEFKKDKICTILLEVLRNCRNISLLQLPKKVRKLCDDYKVVLICDGYEWIQ